MSTFIYDGTFEGLLTAIYDSYYSKEKAEKIVRETMYEHTLISNPFIIATDVEKCDKVYMAIKNKISKNALEIIFTTYLSDIKGCDNLIYDYVKLGFKLGKDVDLHLYDERVRKIHAVSKKVLWEKVRLIELIRFKLISTNLYYAPMEPDHNILALITPHFAERYATQNFIIHDMKRECASIFNTKEWTISPLSKEQGEKFMSIKDALYYEEMWKDYYHSIAIKERINPKLQKKNMPTRYWKYLTEMN